MTRLALQAAREALAEWDACQAGADGSGDMDAAAQMAETLRGLLETTS